MITSSNKPFWATVKEGPDESQEPAMKLYKDDGTMETHTGQK